MNIQETINGLELMLFDLHPKAKSIYEAIDKLKSVTGITVINEQATAKNNATPLSKPYDPKLNYRAKALFAIKELGRFVKTKEIAEFLHQNEPDIPVKDFITALSNPLYFLKNENRVHKISVGTGNGGVYWGAAKWLNEDGSIKPEFMYVEEPKEEEIEL